MDSIESGLRISGSAIAINIVLALIKISTGIIGNSYALIADGVESTMDTVSSLIVFGSLLISVKPPDEDHPFGHGKAESMAGALVAFSLLVASIIIATQSIQEIQMPQTPPSSYTLIVLVAVIVVKETMFRKMLDVGDELESSALKNDAWHHRSDALTSLAAFIGITIAIVGGKGYEAADAWAALLACGLIFYNGIRLLIPSLHEIMDRAAPVEIEEQIRSIAAGVEGVIEIEKCRIRKSGVYFLMDIHVVVRGALSVWEGHRIAHEVQDSLLASGLPIADVSVHIEPDEYV